MTSEVSSNQNNFSRWVWQFSPFSDISKPSCIPRQPKLFKWNIFLARLTELLIGDRDSPIKHLKTLGLHLAPQVMFAVSDLYQCLVAGY